MKIGLTGGIGCGKSTVGLMSADEGIKRCDVDGLVKALLATDVDLIAAIVAHFGEEFLLEGGGISRQKLAKVVFEDTNELAWLENLVHPKVNNMWQKCLADCPNSHWCIEIPLLFEKKLEKHFDIIVCVACSTVNQLARLLARGLSEEQALARNVLQMPLSKKIERADVVITNDGSKAFLREQTQYFIHNFIYN